MSLASLFVEIASQLSAQSDGSCNHDCHRSRALTPWQRPLENRTSRGRKNRGEQGGWGGGICQGSVNCCSGRGQVDEALLRHSVGGV